ncbi:MAG: hypothetical protein NT085_02595 [candidate division SR1 bacterium]|nr:hypothetical protein [candidate division SR1 bacterium]
MNSLDRKREDIIDDLNAAEAKHDFSEVEKLEKELSKIDQEKYIDTTKVDIDILKSKSNLQKEIDIQAFRSKLENRNIKVEKEKEVTKEEVIADAKKIQDDIFTQKTSIYYNKEEIASWMSLKEMIEYGLANKRKIDKILQIVVESIQGKNTARINVGKIECYPFNCPERALLMYYICEKYKKEFGIQSCDIVWPFYHVTNIITFTNGKTYIADGSLGCYSDITENFEKGKTGNGSVYYELKKDVRLLDGSFSHRYKFLPGVANEGKEQFLYILAHAREDTLYMTEKLYEIAQSTPGYEDTKTPDKLRAFLEKEVYTKDILDISKIPGILGTKLGFIL